MKNMKALIVVFPLLLLLTTGCGGLIYTTSNYDEPVNTFSELDSYGHWIYVPQLGNVWQPNAGYNWRPYDNGQWELTDRGWMWFSDEPYNWIVYHYGYWAYTESDRWVWIPGYDWSPSRVRWAEQDDYIGWAPLPPSGWNLPNAYDNNGSNVWIIVHERDFNNRGINKYRVETNSFNNRRNWNYNREPDPGKIRNAGGRNITTVNTQSENVRGGKRDLTRVRIMDGNRRNDALPKTGDNQNNFTPPVVGRERPKQQERPGSEDRNMNNPPQNNQPAKTKDNSVEPKRADENPAVRKNEPDRNRRNDNQPPVEKEKSQQLEKQTDRLNNGDRNMNNPYQNNQPTKTKDNSVEPKRADEKPAVRKNEPDLNRRNDNPPAKKRNNSIETKRPDEKSAVRPNEQDQKAGEQKIEGEKESSRPVIRNFDSSKTKSHVVKIPKKLDDKKETEQIVNIFL